MGKWHEIQASIFNVNFWLFTSRPIKKAWDLCPRSSWSKRPLHEPYFQTEDCKLAWTLNPWIIIILSGDNIYVTGKWCHIKGLSTSWIMKLSLASLKMWLAIELMLGPLRFTSRKKNVKVIMELEVPQKSSCLHYLLLWSNGFCSGRGKIGYLVANFKGPWQKNAIFFSSDKRFL